MSGLLRFSNRNIVTSVVRTVPGYFKLTARISLLRSLQEGIRFGHLKGLFDGYRIALDVAQAVSTGARRGREQQFIIFANPSIGQVLERPTCVPCRRDEIASHPLT